MEPKVDLGKPPPRVVVHVTGWYPVIALAVVFVVASFLNVLYVNYVNRERIEEDRKAAAVAQTAAREQSCRLIVAFDELYKETPPNSPAGQKVAELWAEYRRQLNC